MGKAYENTEREAEGEREKGLGRAHIKKGLQ